MNKCTLTAPAKLNLFLHINGRRPDGYHELETLFTFLDYGDELTFSLTNDNSISITGDTAGIKTEDNLIYKAANALSPFKQKNLGVEIHLSKVLPMGGGVGGGSSDAASTLLALNELWQCNLSVQELANIGIKLGADVPVFIHGKTALAHGIGEELYDVSLPSKWFCVVFPGVHVNTAEVFNHPDLPRQTPKLSGDWQIEDTKNDCQALVKKLHCEVEKTLQWLLKYAPSRMTGTGACCFAEFDSEQAARRVLSQLPSSWQGFVAQSNNQSIAHRQLQNLLKM